MMYKCEIDFRRTIDYSKNVDLVDSMMYKCKTDFPRTIDYSKNVDLVDSRQLDNIFILLKWDMLLETNSLLKYQITKSG